MKLLSQIKKDLEFNLSLSSLIDVLKDIAISEYHIMEKKIRSYDQTFLILQNFFDVIDTSKIQHPLLDPGKRPACVVAITSDTGLLGPLNMQVISLALSEVRENKARLVIIGERGKAYVQGGDTPFVGFDGIKDEQSFTQAMQLRDYLIGEELALRIGVLKVIYPYASSLMVQHTRNLQIFPFVSSKKESGPYPEMIMESSLEDVTEYLAYLFLGQKLHEIFGLSRLAEMAARFVHLEDSSHKLEQMEKELRLQYFRQRHELIDRNMRELFTARLAFKQT